jgi:hypothetical protein
MPVDSTIQSGASSTSVAIDGEDWLVNGVPLYPGRRFRGWRVEGLLLNSRMANGVFDDENPLTRQLWAYPDTGVWDPDRNVSELIAALPAYWADGLRGMTVNLQGGSPLGYYRGDRLTELVARIRRRHPDASTAQIWAGLPGPDSQPWLSSGFDAAGRLKPACAARAARLIQAADAFGIVVILGLFYFGQDERLADGRAVRRAVEEACGFILDRGFGNVVIEINNECDVPRYEHESLRPARVHELIELARSVTRRGRRLLVSTSFTRDHRPTDAVCRASDFILLHGNGVDDPGELARLVDATRALPGYRPMPILFNEDDHFDFDRPDNNFTAALSRRAGWGYFDPGAAAGGGLAFGDYAHGFQNPPVNWGITSPRKRAFFRFLRAVTGSDGE